jgi:hypothetical protein
MLWVRIYFIRIQMYFLIRYISSIRLGRMNLTWKELPEQVRTRLETDLRNSDRFDSYSLPLLLTGLQWLEYRWNDQKDTRDTVLSAFVVAFSNVQEAHWEEFFNCLNRLVVNDVKWKDLPSDVTETILKGIESGSHCFTSRDVTDVLRR